ncbi:MAG TPA: low-specificity L-threonine aldolase [Herpetosiphonaceae bacterium]|nr:low-specificity L-threonine aldolase [Herpetosiphonaceae bacterium]
MIDLRSDTVTQPSPEMREAMARAEVGDDVYGEDPTVNRLQDLAAEILGKEAALFVASGTMGNLCSLLAHCGRGDEVILGDESHIFHYEQGGASALGGMVYHTVPTSANGELPVGAIRRAIRDARDPHAARAGVICLENTHNRRGGAVLPLDYMQQVKALADEHDLPVHLDGARLANAAVALGVSLSTIAAHVSSVQLDLSKGLAAPVGGVIAGRRTFIERAHRARKVVGGGMRQAGIIAAAGIVALDRMIERLVEDHEHARLLAAGLQQFQQITIDPEHVQTNIVVFRLSDPAWSPASFIHALREQGVLIGGFGDERLRMVTHYGIGRTDIDATCAAVGRVFAAFA